MITTDRYDEFSIRQKVRSELVSTSKAYDSPKWDGTRCLEELTSCEDRNKMYETAQIQVPLATTKSNKGKNFYVLHFDLAQL